jgi:hypothetical protein
MEISFHPARELTFGTNSAGDSVGRTLTGGETIDGTAKPMVLQRYRDHVTGDYQSTGLCYTDMVNYCASKVIPFICIESDPSKTKSSPCWVPDWAGQWMFEDFQAWDATLRAAGSCFIQGMYENSNTSKGWLFPDPDDEAVVRAGVDAQTISLPNWYLKEIASGPISNVNASLPVSDATWGKIKAELTRRHGLWVDNFKAKWGT